MTDAHDTLCERLIALSEVSSDIMERHDLTESEMKTIVERLVSFWWLDIVEEEQHP